MKKLILLIAILGIFGQSNAQQLPLFSQYYFNSFIYNPSHSGLEEGTSLSLVGRKQFTGLANSIGTYAATLQTRTQGKRSGFGIYAYNDNVSLFRTNAITGSYAYHIPLAKEKVLSFGLALSALDHRYNSSNFNLISNEDPVVALLGSEGGFSFDANAGVNIDFGKFSMGLANLQMLQNQEAFSDNADVKSLYTLANHWMFNMAYTASLNENFELEPYMLYRKTQGAPGQVDLNVFLNWVDKGYAGIAYRDGMSFSTMLGAHVNQNITLGYAYDITTHKLRSALGNTHEVMLRFNLGGNSPKSQGDDVLASKDKQKYENKISDLEKEITDLKALPKGRTDTVILEKVIVKEVPVIKEVIKYKEPVETEKPTTSGTPTTVDPKPVYVDDPHMHTDPAPTTPETAPQFYVIAGSFASSTAANSHITRLGNKGHAGYQKYDPTSGRYYVHIGNFTTKEQAVSLIQQKKGAGLPLWVKSM